MICVNNYKRIQAKLNIMKLKPRSGALYYFQQTNGMDLLSIFWGPHRATKMESSITYDTVITPQLNL